MTGWTDDEDTYLIHCMSTKEPLKLIHQNYLARFKVTRTLNSLIGRMTRLKVWQAGGRKPKIAQVLVPFSFGPKKIKKVKVSEEVVLEVDETIVPLRKTPGILMRDLNGHPGNWMQCRYGYDGDPILFCGDVVMLPECPWCLDHAKLVYNFQNARSLSSATSKILAALLANVK